MVKGRLLTVQVAFSATFLTTSLAGVVWLGAGLATCEGKASTGTGISSFGCPTMANSVLGPVAATKTGLPEGMFQTTIPTQQAYPSVRLEGGGGGGWVGGMGVWE